MKQLFLDSYKLSNTLKFHSTNVKPGWIAFLDSSENDFSRLYTGYRPEIVLAKEERRIAFRAEGPYLTSISNFEKFMTRHQLGVRWSEFSEIRFYHRDEALKICLAAKQKGLEGFDKVSFY